MEFYSGFETQPKNKRAKKVATKTTEVPKQERYSYDEVRAIAYKAYCIGQLDEPTEGKFNQWINQFKKEQQK